MASHGGERVLDQLRPCGPGGELPPPQAHAGGAWRGIEAFDPEAAQRAIRSALLLGSHHDAFARVVWPAWQRIRRGWLEGELGRHHERLAAEIFGHVVRDMLRQGQPPSPAAWAVLGCFADEDDIGPALGAALALQSAGMRVLFLGPRTRTAVVREAAAAVSAAVVGLSLTEEVSTRGARDLVDEYTAAIDGRRWFVTGPGAASVEAMVQGSGGDVASEPGDVRGLARP